MTSDLLCIIFKVFYISLRFTRIEVNDRISFAVLEIFTKETSSQPKVVSGDVVSWARTKKTLKVLKMLHLIFCYTIHIHNLCSKP